MVVARLDVALAKSTKAKSDWPDTTLSIDCVRAELRKQDHDVVRKKFVHKAQNSNAQCHNTSRSWQHWHVPSATKTASSIRISCKVKKWLILTVHSEKDSKYKIGVKIIVKSRDMDN